MYRILTIEDRVRVPPEKLGTEVKEAVKESLAESLDGKINKDVGIFLAILDVSDLGEGIIEPEDAGIFFDAKYRALVFQPELHEITKGEVTEITEFGTFIRIGPIDGLCHVSQVMDDFVSYDEKQNRLVGKENKKSLQVGDVVLARIIAVSLDKREVNKINLTMRQPGLGSIKWFEEEAEKKKKEGKKEEK